MKSGATRRGVNGGARGDNAERQKTRILGGVKRGGEEALVLQTVARRHVRHGRRGRFEAAAIMRRA